MTGRGSVNNFWQRGTPTWRSPIPLSEKLTPYLDDVYIDSALRSPAMVQEAWNNRYHDYSEMSDISFIRIMGEYSPKQMTMKQFRILDTHSLTVGEIAFVLSRYRSLNNNLEEAVKIFWRYRHVMPEHEMLGWCLLWHDMGITKNEISESALILHNQGISFDEVTRFYKAGVTNPHAILRGVKYNIDTELTAAMLAN